jgi:sterol desaturase/sphingolipid hydroxylase (fatty acid hydroxylase superfamily)
MDQALLYWEPAARFAVFIGVFAVMAGWEILAPRRDRRYARSARWPNNLGLLAVDVLAVRILAPGAAIAVAIAGEAEGRGVLRMVDLPVWANLLIAIVLLDLVIYLQHVAFHALPTLWRLHRVHHADPDLDVTSGTRFHPIEIFISVIVKCVAVAVIGAPALAVLLFEILLNALAMFNHANARVPLRLDRWLRWFLVTPDVHRVHHSTLTAETNSNYGFNLTCWDRLFGTYRAQPAAGHERMQLGVGRFDQAADQRLARLLMQPFEAEPKRSRSDDPDGSTTSSQ